MSDDNNAELERLRSIEKLAGLLLHCDDEGNTTLIGHEKFRSALRRVCCWGGTLPKDYEHAAEIEYLRARIAELEELLEVSTSVRLRDSIAFGLRNKLDAAKKCNIVLADALAEHALGAEAILLSDDLGNIRLSKKMRAHLRVSSRRARETLKGNTSPDIVGP